MEKKNKDERSASAEDLISNYPETKKFLEARGLQHIRELDKQGRGELREYLEKILNDLRGTVH